jgi:hypothetical protein
MNKGLSVAAGLLAVAALCLPWILGTRSQAVYESALTRLQEQGVRVLGSDYQRGWFDSQASVRLELTLGAGPLSANGAIPVRIESQVAHGPWFTPAPRPIPAAALIESQVHLALPGLELPLLLLETRVEPSGGGVAVIRVPAVARKTAVTRLEMAPGGGELRFAPGFAAVEGSIDLPALTLSIQDRIFVDLRQLSAEGAGSRRVSGLLTGDARLTLRRSELRTPAMHLIAGGLSVDLKAAPAAEFVSMDLDYRSEDLSLHGADYGASRVSLSLRRFPGAALASLRQAMRELSLAGADGSAYRVAMAAILAQHLPGLLGGDPELALERAEIGTPAGVIQGRVSLASRGLTAQALQRPGGWLEHLVGEGQLSLPRALVLGLLEDWQRREVLERTPRRNPTPKALPERQEREIAVAARDRLDLLVRQGWLAEEGEGVTAVARLADSLLTINGKTLPVGTVAP